MNYAKVNSTSNNYLTPGSLLDYIISGSLTSYAPTNNQAFTGTLIAPAITLNGTDASAFYQPKFTVAGYVQLNGTFGASYGRVSFTSTKTGTGAYTLTFSSNIGSVLCSVIGGLRNAVVYISYNGTAATGVNIQTYTTAGVQTDNAFNFYILS